MKTIIRHEDNKDLAEVTCSQCGRTKTQGYWSAKRNPDGVCASCTTSNKNKSSTMKELKAKKVDKDVKDKNSKENGLFIIEFTDRRQKCIVKCKHCKNEYERLYKPNIYEQYGCKLCSRVIAAKNTQKHKIRHDTRLYRIYNSMLNRTGHYGNGDSNYLELDIRVCKEWIEDRHSFFDWALLNGYSDELTIDRINNSLGYSPDNCRWSTPLIQSRNQRKLNSLNTSGYRGVSLTQKKDKYRSRITINYNEINLCTHKSAKVCAYYYDKHIVDNNLEHTKNFTEEEFRELEASIKLLEL